MKQKQTKKKMFFNVNGLQYKIVINQTFGNEIKITADHFNHFVRLNNRKKFYSIDEIISFGYIAVESKIEPLTSFVPVRIKLKWCENNIGKYRFLYLDQKFVFADQNDATLFSLRWH